MPVTPNFGQNKSCEDEDVDGVAVPPVGGHLALEGVLPDHVPGLGVHPPPDTLDPEEADEVAAATPAQDTLVGHHHYQLLIRPAGLVRLGLSHWCGHLVGEVVAPSCPDQVDQQEPALARQGPGSHQAGVDLLGRREAGIQGKIQLFLMLSVLVKSNSPLKQAF